MIPKKLHYIWFGKKEKPEFVQFCINSWKKTLPNFEIIEWNEDNFDFAQNTFAREAYEQKKWAFVSDYARAKILHQEGGFYVDTDMEIRLPLDEFTQYRAVCGFEVAHVPFSAFFAVERQPVHLAGACLAQAVGGIGEYLGRRIVDVAFQLDDGLGRIGLAGQRGCAIALHTVRILSARARFVHPNASTSDVAQA